MNQCQIITFLILTYDIIENSRIELRGIVLPVQVGGLLGGQRVCWPPPSQIIGGTWPFMASPVPTPMYCPNNLVMAEIPASHLLPLCGQTVDIQSCKTSSGLINQILNQTAGR